MQEFSPTVATMLTIGMFAVVYFLFLARKTIRNTLDLYDFILLSMVAVVPAIFVLFPAMAQWLGDLTGVAFPFIIMFGALLVIVFILLHRLTVNIYQLQKRSHHLVQEVSLLRQKLEQDGKEK